MPPAPTDIPPPTVADCPLLAKYGGPDADRLVARFAAVAAEVQAVAADRQLAAAYHGGQFDDQLRLLARARNLMTQRRYAVGCIGITQAGKSTTVNNVLGEEVCKPGSGDACSSQPSRISYADRRALDIEYLTAARFDDRREKLCAAIGLATPPDDRELIPQLERPESFREIEGPDRPRLREDVKHLHQFLTAKARNPNLIADPPKQIVGEDYGKRYAYTTHTSDAPRPEVLLVREARFRIDNRQLPEDLELCDLPGLDSKRTIDDLVTWEYLPELHGTFLFVNVGGNLLTEGMVKILLRLKADFKHGVAGRAWVIFNKMDTLTADHFRPGKDNIFDIIGKFLEAIGIPESQVVFCSKKIWDAARAGQPSPLAASHADPAAAAQIMGQPAASPVPEACPPGLRPAWNELLRDGGIGHLRTLMFRDVATALAAEIRRDVSRLLDEFHAEFERRVAAARRRLTMDRSELIKAMTCRNVVLNLRGDLGTRPGDFAVLAEQGDRLRQVLTALFEAGDAAKLVANLPPAELSRQFRVHARMLSEELRGELSRDVLDEIYNAIGDRLDGLPPVPLGAVERTCRDVWRGISLDDLVDESWRTDLPEFASDDLVRWIARPDGDGLDGGLYVELWHEKIRVAVRQTIHLIRARLRYRLGGLAGELAVLAGEGEPSA